MIIEVGSFRHRERKQSLVSAICRANVAISRKTKERQKLEEITRNATRSSFRIEIIKF